ncbi:hypothetical protein [Cellulomonas soli]
MGRLWRWSQSLGAGNSYAGGVEFGVAADDFADTFYDVSVEGVR